MAINTYASHAPLPPPTREASNAPAITNPAPPTPTASTTPVVQRHATLATAVSSTSEARTSRKTTVDASTGDLVYQVIDNHTGQKLDQSPEEAMLRIRAYVRQIDASKQADAAAPKANAKG
jgi:hypothetical protein